MSDLFHKLFYLLLHASDNQAWQDLIDAVGVRNFYLLIGVIVFVETGLVVMPFLPGDSLLFAVGTVTARPDVGLRLGTALAVLFAAAILGDNCNYWLGRTIGPKVFAADDAADGRRSWKSRLLNRKHLRKAQSFYETHGRKTIVLARFVPIVRTFAPFVAGVGRMSYPTFLAFSVAGGAAWVVLCTLAGWWFGGLPFVQKHFELIVLAIIGISLVPVAIEFWRARSAERRGGDAVVEATTVGERSDRA